MSLIKIGEKALQNISKQDKDNQLDRVIKKKTLDEDEYIEGLESIIVRDFYPDLPKLRAKTVYLEAIDNNDHQKLREMQAKYDKDFNPEDSPSIYQTPATFETPDVRTDPEKTRNFTKEEANMASHRDKKEHLPLHLDTYLSQNTSEDNASFSELMHENEEKRKRKHAWLYDNERKCITAREEQTALPTIEQQAIETTSRIHKPLDSWTYKAYNALMYNPKGVELSENEKIEEAGKNKQEINYANTRLNHAGGERTRNLSQQVFNQAIDAKKAACRGRIGVDGKELTIGDISDTPTVMGYKFSDTPSPMPGANESPLMTWGTLQDTPLMVHGVSTPAPIFRIPDVPNRDRIGLDLAEKVGKTMREKKQKALKTVSDRLRSPASRSPFICSPLTPKQPLSVAARKLLGNKFSPFGSDRALRDSYTPSPKSTASSRTFGNTPQPSPLGSASSSVKTTPTKTPVFVKVGAGFTTRRAPSTPTSETTVKIGENLTDNLLSLPKRRKVATDFF